MSKESMSLETVQALQPLTTPLTVKLAEYVKALKAKTVPQLLPQKPALQGIEVGPGLLSVFGADPGLGKTALGMRVLYDAIELIPDLRVIIAEADTEVETLLCRELVRLTRLPSEKVRFANLDQGELTRVEAAADELNLRIPNVLVLDEPYTLAQLLRLLDEQPGLLFIDYLQLFAPRDLDPRQGVGEAHGHNADRMQGTRAIFVHHVR